jgi:hypothetical protein
MAFTFFSKSCPNHGPVRYDDETPRNTGGIVQKKSENVNHFNAYLALLLFYNVKCNPTLTGNQRARYLNHFQNRALNEAVLFRKAWISLM